MFLSHANNLETATAKYPIKGVVCKSFQVPATYFDGSHEKLYTGQLPTRIVIGLVGNRAFNGSREHSPFNYRHCNVSEILLYLVGEQQYALKPLQPNFQEGLYVRTYNTLFAGTNKINRDEGNFITREDNKAGYALYAFDLTTDLAESDHFNLVKHGSVRLALRFFEPTPHTISIIAYAEFEIGHDRNSLVDFGV